MHSHIRREAPRVCPSLQDLTRTARLRPVQRGGLRFESSEFLVRFGERRPNLVHWPLHRSAESTNTTELGKHGGTPANQTRCPLPLDRYVR